MYIDLCHGLTAETSTTSIWGLGSILLNKSKIITPYHFLWQVWSEAQRNLKSHVATLQHRLYKNACEIIRKDSSMDFLLRTVKKISIHFSEEWEIGWKEYISCRFRPAKVTVSRKEKNPDKSSSTVSVQCWKKSHLTAKQHKYCN